VERFVEVLKLVASPFDAQVATLPNFVVVADEIALLYSDELKLAKAQGVLDRLSGEVQAGLAGLDDEIEQMSGEADLWTNESLKTAAQWTKLREQARQILSLLGREPGLPKLSWTTYVEGSR
jgi:hypothetical protein